jgi:Mrp family chromosome partitioning ATPase
MDNIRQALERARAVSPGDAGQKSRAASNPPRPQVGADSGIGGSVNAPSQEIALDAKHLESKRIIAHDDTDPRSKPFDMLRTQVLQSMDQKKWKIVGVTSPTPGCGKTVTAVNLALSIARQPERSVFLVDLDLQKPNVASCMGLACESGVVSVLEGRTSLSSAIIQARVGQYRLLTLPTESSTSNSSTWMASRAMSTMLQEIQKDYQSHIIIVDLPPMLSSDDVLAVLPQLDCVLLVAAVGKSKVAEIDECNRHLASMPVVRFVLNKVPKLNAQYYSPYGSRS